MFGFAKAYIKSMRLYYAFVTGIAGWLGVSYYEYIAKIQLALDKKIVILVILFLSWGINQIINDYLGLEEDKINAPNRPMVNGELDPKKAVIVSMIILLMMSSVIVLYLEPLAVIPAILGVVLNIIYEYAKGYNILGNIAFGLMISMCTVLGFLGSGPLIYPIDFKNLMSLVSLVCIINGVMTFYTYFKDFEGDKIAQKKTIVVQFGIEKSRYISLIFSLIPLAFFMTLVLLNLLIFEFNSIFIFLAILTLFIEIWTGYLFYKHPIGEKTYYSLSINFRACVCAQATLIALFDSTLAMSLFILSYIFVGFLFSLHSDRKA